MGPAGSYFWIIFMRYKCDTDPNLADENPYVDPLLK